MKIRELRHNLWNIGFIEDGLENTINNKTPKINWVKKRFNDRWFADPFILDVTDNEIVILAEEYCYSVRKGRIARLVIDRKSYEEKRFEIILEHPTHLSFPFIIRQNSKVYILPESSANGCSTIYEYNDTNRELNLCHKISDEPFVDATIFDINEKSYLFTTILPDSNSKSINIYAFDKEKLQVTDKIATIEFLIACGRNAGEAFTVDRQLYRPAQDCTLRYGHGVILQKIIMKDEEWCFESVNSFYPYTFKYNLGIHTFNNYKGLIVIDGRGYRNPIIGRMMTILYNFIGKK